MAWVFHGNRCITNSLIAGVLFTSLDERCIGGGLCLVMFGLLLGRSSHGCSHAWPCPEEKLRVWWLVERCCDAWNLKALFAPQKTLLRKHICPVNFSALERSPSPLDFAWNIWCSALRWLVGSLDKGARKNEYFCWCFIHLWLRKITSQRQGTVGSSTTTTLCPSVKMVEVTWMSSTFRSNTPRSLMDKGWGPETNVGGNPNKNQWKRVDRGLEKEARAGSGEKYWKSSTYLYDCLCRQGDDVEHWYVSGVDQRLSRKGGYDTWKRGFESFKFHSEQMALPLCHLASFGTCPWTLVPRNAATASKYGCQCAWVGPRESERAGDSGGSGPLWWLDGKMTLWGMEKIQLRKAPWPMLERFGWLKWTIVKPQLFCSAIFSGKKVGSFSLIFGDLNESCEGETGRFVQPVGKDQTHLSRFCGTTYVPDDFPSGWVRLGWALLLSCHSSVFSKHSEALTHSCFFVALACPQGVSFALVDVRPDSVVGCLAPVSEKNAAAKPTVEEKESIPGTAQREKDCVIEFAKTTVKGISKCLVPN